MKGVSISTISFQPVNVSKGVFFKDTMGEMIEFELFYGSFHYFLRVDKK